MSRTTSRNVFGLLVTLAAALGPGQTAWPQEAALRDRVQQLVGRLAGPEAEAEKAEKALVDLGTRALPLLPEAKAVTSAAARTRLDRVRAAIAEAGTAINLDASKVTISGDGVRLTEALQAIQRQSGNVVTDLREQMGQDVTNPALDLELKDVPFFEALDQMAEKAGLSLNFYTNDGSIGLMEKQAAMPGPAGEAAAPAAANPLVTYSGPFRIQLLEVVAKRDFATGQAAANTRLEIAWEPRLRPMLLSIESEGLTITDDRGQAVPPSLMEEETSVPLRAENPIAELNLNMAAPSREAQKLAKLKVKANVTIPAGSRLFRFKDLSKPGTATQQDITVDLVSTEVEDFVWKIRLMIGMPGEGPAFESYQQGLFNNRIWLQKADGSRFEHNGGYSNLGSSNGKMGFEYVFVDAPGKPADYQLVYETPSKIEVVPVEFEFKDVPLP